MSRDVIELAHRFFDAYNRRDLEAFRTLLHQDGRIVPMFSSVEGKHYVGHDGVRRWFEDISLTFRDTRIEIVRAEEHGDWVLLDCLVTAHGLASGAEIRQPFAIAGHFRGDQADFSASLATTEDARRAIENGDETLRAAGLSE